MPELEFDYDKEMVRYIINHNLYDEKTYKITKKIYPVLGIRNQKLDEKTGGYYGGEQYVKGFTIKPPRQDTCQYCLTKLTGSQRHFCGSRCSDLYSKLKKELIKLEIDNVFWHENKDREIPQKKDMFGIKEGKNGKQIIIKNIITKKSGKLLVKDSKESKDFSKGKDY